MSIMNRWKNKKWVVAVSGGSDSMALLNMCVEENMDIIVAHVNYQKRESANRDMLGVQNYCEKKGIVCHSKIVEKYNKTGNFQAEAREIRYAFFKKLVIENACEGVLVAHHKDDVLETYLLNEQASRIPSYYGIKEEVVIKGVKVVRPLLSYTKEELENYCKQHHVLYYVDESNASLQYARNRIRHNVLPSMSEEEKKELLLQLEEKNRKNEKDEQYIQEYLKDKQCLDLSDLNTIEEEIRGKILRSFINKESGYMQLSKKALDNMVLFLTNKKVNGRHTINGEYDLVVEYGKVFLEKKEEEIEYSYQLNSIEYFDTPYFKIRDKGKTIESVFLKEEDFPITIRNAKTSDVIQMRFGKKKVGRFFIDRKIPHKDRKIWPVIINKEGNVIFVCGIGCDIEHYSNNSLFFMIK